LVAHIGMTGVGMPDRFEGTLRHMAHVNGQDLDSARRLVERAFKVWKRRSGASKYRSGWSAVFPSLIQ
jgi:hypothetical protein